MNLFPKDEKFFKLLEQQSNLILDAAKALYDGVQAGAAAMAMSAANTRISGLSACASRMAASSVNACVPAAALAS